MLFSLSLFHSCFILLSFIPYSIIVGVSIDAVCLLMYYFHVFGVSHRTRAALGRKDASLRDLAVGGIGSGAAVIAI